MLPFLQHNLLRNSFITSLQRAIQRLRQHFFLTPNECLPQCVFFLKAMNSFSSAFFFIVNFHATKKKADFGLLWCFLLHKRVSLGEKQLMVNLVFQRGQDVTRLQTAIFFSVLFHWCKRLNIFSLLATKKKKKLSASSSPIPFFLCFPSFQQIKKAGAKNGFQFSFG